MPSQSALAEGEDDVIVESEEEAEEEELLAPLQETSVRTASGSKTREARIHTRGKRKKTADIQWQYGTSHFVRSLDSLFI